ncbi:MAG: type I restriction endonuclease subunit R [Lachnospiraceae bacterium]|nr:type I restriction endonuclease subunit R [Lachnospiraceae bacterium]
MKNNFTKNKIFNEDTRVKIPALCHFLSLGYKYINICDSSIDYNTNIFKDLFKKSIIKINNKNFSDNEIDDIIIDISKTLGNNDLGKEFYNWLVNPNDKVKLIDFDNISNNEFYVVDELPFLINVDSEKGSFRPDINILINGMPLAFLEVKKPNNEGGIQEEFKRMLDNRLKKDEYKRFFNMIQITSFSNNMEYEELDSDEDVKAGSFYSTPNSNNTSFSFFREDDESYFNNYKYLQLSEDNIKVLIKKCGYDEKEYDTPEFKLNLSHNTPVNKFITSLYDKERILYMLNYGVQYIDGSMLEKHIMRYPQFFATRKIIERLESGGKNGIIWHTQGSGKTALASFATKVINRYYENKDISTRFFFIVDRLDLLQQASDEFKARGLTVINCKNKEELMTEIKKPISKSRDKNSIGEICVANVQKLDSELEEVRNDYNVKVQRIFFIDEAHRSYQATGEYFKNLMTCDVDAIYIALTGTPLLTKKERSSLKFGDYIHKYFYDKSIADRYTLKIKKENIDTIAKSEILNNLDLEEKNIDEKEIFESPQYIDNLGRFIEKDFKNFRLENDDNTIGGMIVCRTNPQAKLIYEWFKSNSKLDVGLVISDTTDPTQNERNKNYQIDFKKTNKPDILVVNLMLTTGYDVKRLKKMYLLRGPHAQALLQTISRVNRPYKSPNGRVYKYGYIVDFVDIEKEYNATIDAYIKELERDLNSSGDNEESLAGLVIDKEDIKKKYDKLEEELKNETFGININNLELFSKFIDNQNKDSLYKIRRILKNIKDCEIEFLLSRAIDYAKLIDSSRNKKLKQIVQSRIDFYNLKSKPVEMMNIISNDEVVKIIYQFIKRNIVIMDMSKFDLSDEKADRFKTVISNIQNEIKKNKNKNDIRIVKLNELLQKVFDKMNITDASDLDDISEELAEIYNSILEINESNNRMAEKYGNNFAFVKTYQDITSKCDIETNVLENMLRVVYEDIADIVNEDSLIIQGNRSFISSIKERITTKLISNGLYSKIRKCYDEILNDLYINLQSHI